MKNSSLVSHMPRNGSSSPGNRIAVDGPHNGQQPHFSTWKNNGSNDPKMRPLPSWESSARKEAQDAYRSFTASSANMQNSDFMGRDGSADVNISKFTAQPLDANSHFSIAPSNLPGKPFSSPSKAYHPRGNFPYLSNGEHSRTFQGTSSTGFSSNGQSVIDIERNKMTGYFNRGRGPGILCEESRGPRAGRSLGSSSSSSTTRDCSNSLMNRDRYNRSDFRIEYKQAKFFMIKSFSEDDIHKSIKYNVWSSTPRGNKKLDATFCEVEARLDKGTKCPIFLLFSVNGSGQFVGLAEMFGPVDLKKTMNFWQQDRWHGFFPVKWHIIKDIPNVLFSNILLENNDNKRVTASRDTQEIGLHHGLRMLSIFKDFQARTCILDDFAFYEEKEKSLRANRSAAQQVAMRCCPDHAEPVRRTVLSRRFEGREDSRNAASLAALTERLSIQSTQGRLKRPMMPNYE